jgi:hypothetical protein
LGILRDEFRPKYCLERYQIGDMVMNYAFPVVCFCDIPLSQIRAHIKTYGNYGLGLAKTWGEAQGLNPVLYVKRDSKFSRHILGVAQYLADRYPGTGLDEGIDQLIGVLSYMKPYSGEFTRGSQLFTDVRFYDEREWRLVFRTPRRFLPEAAFLDPIERAQADQVIAAKRLSFEPTDIKYVIVDRADERLSIVKALREIKSPKYPQEVIDVLTSRIITCEEVTSDF